MIIHKFGGVAMKNQEMRMMCIKHIEDGISKFGKVVVVVSAIGRQGDPYSTDTLLNLTSAFSTPSLASDLAASCGELIATAVLSAELSQAGIQNSVLHSAQTGILTSGDFGDGEIDQINTQRITTELSTVDCVIVPGFQGIDQYGNLQTLGRGGSDLTAIALGAALHASHIEFFKDVSGVMTHDPKENEQYQKLDSLTFDEFLPLLNSTRPIIQKRAAQYAIKKAIPLYIRGIADLSPGTWILP